MNTPLIAVLGPTASGKSTLAVHLARTFGGEVVSCDSIQIYRYLDIGSSKVTREEQQGVRHHLMDFLDPGTLFTAGEYMSLGRAALREIQVRRKIPIVVGGTGLYLRALLEGLFEGPKRSEALRERLRKLVQKHGSSYLHAILQRVDTASAAQISPRDSQKLIRALEVYFLTSKPLSAHFQSGRDCLSGFEVMKIGLHPDRKALYAAIEARVDEMFAHGLVHEVEEILRCGFSPELKPLRSLGYAQAVDHLQKRISLADAIAETKLETRRYAKRQLTWFRKESAVIWLRGFGSQPVVQSEARRLASAFVQGGLKEAGVVPQSDSATMAGG